ncbi:MAG: beta strand repeat-containing protein, partial [Roseimicrobium sp.]
NKGFNPGWTDSYSNNIGVIINGGHLEAMLAVGLVNESAAEGKMSSAISRLNSKVDKWNVNAGAWYEGTDYGIFTKWGFGQAMPAMEMALGSTFGLSRIVGVSAAAKEPLTIASNNRQRFTFSDVGTGSEAAIGWANWFARRFNALESFDYSRQAGNSPLNALTLPETTLSPEITGLNPDTAFRGPADSAGGDFAEVVTMREKWTDTKATFVGGMGGAFDSHGHLQSGTFQLSARGVKWFVDLTSEDYSVPNHNGTTPNPSGPDRWDYYRWRAEGHNCLIVNPTNMPDRIWNAPYAPMLNYQSAQNGQRSFATWDLTNNITGVTKVQRGIQLFSNRKQVLIQDEIVHPTPTTCWWFAHFRNDQVSVTISGDGSSVTLQSGTERLWGKIVSGGGSWTVRAARPLPTSPNPAEANPNTLFSKLAIQLTNVTNTTLAVWFVPLAPGEIAPTTTPTITALNTWNLVAQNEAPVAQSSGANSIGGAAVDVNLRTLVTDDWTPITQLTFAASGAVGGTVAVQPDGFTARYTPTSGFTGAQSFTFTATDADGATSSAATIIIGASPVVTNWTSTASGSWSTAANWQGSVAPVSGRSADIYFFNGQTLAATTITATNDLAGTTDANKLTFSGTGTATTVVNVDGNPLRLVRNGATSPTITLSGITAGYRYNIANDITLDDSVTINASNTGTFVFNGAITGSGGITRTSTSSTLILAGNNTYTGPSTISAGTLQIGNDGASGTLGSGAVSVGSGATLRFDRTGTVDVPNDISGAGALFISGPALTDVVNLTGDNSFTGTVNISSGSLRITDAAQLGSGAKSITATSATAALRLDGSAGAVVLPAQFSISTSNPNGAIINEAGDNEIGSGVTLTGGAGATRITSSAGTLTIQGNVAPNFTGRSLDLRGAGNGVINGGVLDGTAPNTLGTVSKNEAGTWTLNGNNSFTGGTTVSGGKLVINGTHNSGAVTVASGATLAGRGSITAPITVNGTLAPGDGVGTMNFTNTLSFASTSRLQWELGSNSLAGDQLTSTAAISVTAGAKIDVVLNSLGSETTYLLSFWRSARSWPVITGTSLSGSFTLGTVSGDAAGHATATYGAFSLQHTATGVNLVWTPIPGFPIIDEPIVTFTQPTVNPAALPNVESRLRIAATASGGGTISYAWSVVAGEGGSTGSVTFGNANAADTTATFSEPGSYTLRCTATNEAVSRYADLIVLVAPATTLVLQEDLDGYSHRASYLMGNSTAWNHGTDPQMRVGRNSSAGQRAVLGFPLDGLPAGSVIRSAKLDVWTDATTGVGTVSALELRKLTRSFVEGTGDGSASTNGAGSGVTWANYNGTTAWTTAGGDYAASVLSSVIGFDATVPSVQKTFVSTLPLVAAAQAALDADSALELMLLSPSTEANTTANNYTNLKSNDHADAAQRPRLTLDFTFNSLPTIDPGSVSDAGVGFPLSLNGVVTFATSSTWSFVSGPGTATFANAASPATSVIFSATGNYVLRLTATNALGEASRDLAVTVASVPSGFAAWQAANWPGVSDVLIIGPNADPDGDGVTNAIEFNAGTDPKSSVSVPSFVWNR